MARPTAREVADYLGIPLAEAAQMLDGLTVEDFTLDQLTLAYVRTLREQIAANKVLAAALKRASKGKPQ